MSAPRDFRERGYQLSPPFWRGPNGERKMGALGLTFDLVAEGLQQGVLARFLASPILPSDALPRHGRDRAMPRFPGDSDESYKARLLDAWDSWGEAGTDLGVIHRFGEFGVTATVQEANSGSWDWDGDADNWSRWWAVITDHEWVDDGTWGSGGTWGDGGTWGSSASFDEVESIRWIARAHGRSGTLAVYIIVVLDGGSWSGTPDGTWDEWENRDSGAIYISG